MPAATQPAAPLTRRERQRQATSEEIVQVSRRLLRRDKTISLRAVAQDMGMTAPALYRYVDGYDELILVVGKAIFTDLTSTIKATVAKYPADDPGAQLVTAAVAFRRWALANPDEFGLLFASRETADHQLKEAGNGGDEFVGAFSEVFARVYDRYQFPLPSSEDMTEPVAQALEFARTEGMLPCEFPDYPVGLIWVFMRAWARLYGMVTLEVFGHLEEFMTTSGAMFAAMMEDNGRDLNLGDDWPRLRELVQTELGG